MRYAPSTSKLAGPTPRHVAARDEQLERGVSDCRREGFDDRAAVRRLALLLRAIVHDASLFLGALIVRATFLPQDPHLIGHLGRDATTRIPRRQRVLWHELERVVRGQIAVRSQLLIASILPPGSLSRRSGATQRRVVMISKSAGSAANSVGSRVPNGVANSCDENELGAAAASARSRAACGLSATKAEAVGQVPSAAASSGASNGSSYDPGLIAQLYISFE